MANKEETKKNEKTYENRQIIRIDGKSKFVEVLDTGFDIGKVALNFIEYDDSKKSGERITQQIMIYMDFAKFRVFAHDMLSGRFAKLAADKKLRYQDLTGTPAERLKAQNREREDGKAESRKLSLTPSAKGFFFTAESGPGEEMETGLIKPAGKAEKKVSIPMDADQSKQLVLMTLAAIDAYETAKATTKQMKSLLNEQLKNLNRKSYY